MAPRTKSTTGMIDGQYPDGANSQDWECEQCVSSVTARFSSVSGGIGILLSIMAVGGPLKYGLHEAIPIITVH